ncbi:MAG: NADH-quinone oxidoreductase subunit NuoH [Nitrospiraceae bacterium]|nr:MAG: NADH-quinone oxidoreductase subunit NuoH [Nitrospiraceae bacterium]
MLVFAGASVVKIAVVMVTVLLTVAVLTLAERKVLSWMQDRMGPMEVGPYGILQPIADGIKLFFKEDIIPSGANWVLFSLAPIISLIPAFIGFAVVPYGPNIEYELYGVTIKPFIITDINIGILYILAFTSIGAYGVILGGWASNNKYSLLGGLRAAAQVISYELNVGLAIIGVIILSGSLSMVTIAEKQAGGILNWNIIGMGHGLGIWWWIPVTQVVGFVVYVISSVAETNRLPFDLPEADSELVAGWMTEYSGMRFAFFFMAEYANMILVSCIASVLFLGGYHAPYPGTLFPGILGYFEGIAWFTVKVYGFLFLFFWIRATLPRLRYDQLMRFGWKVMLPLALANIVITSIVVYFLR